MPIPKQTIEKKAIIPFQVAIHHVFQPMHNSCGEVVSLVLQPETEIRDWLRVELKTRPWINFTEDPQLSKFVGTYCGYRFCSAIENLDAYNHVLYYYGTQEILTTWDPYCVIKRHDKLPPLPENLSTPPIESPQAHTMFANQYRWLRDTMSKRYVPVFDYPWQMYGGVYRTSPADLRGITMASYAFFRGLGGEGRKTPLPQPWNDICVHEGCTKYRQGGKLCRAHGSPRRPPCRIEGCSTESATLVRGLCTRHDPRGAICNAPGCTRFKQRRGFCRTHLGSREQCQSKGCIQFVDAHGSCPKHGRFKPKPRACPVCKTRGVRHSDERCHFRRQERQQEEPKQATPPKPPRAEPAPLPETSPAPFTWKLLKKQP